MTTQFIDTAAQTNRPEHRKIDGPKAKGLRRTLRILRLILQPTEYMDDNVRRYGPMFKIGGDSSPPLVYVGDPEVVREIFMLDATQAATGQSNGIMQAMVGEHSILLLDGNPHQRQRKLLMPPFHGDRLRAYGQLICDITRQVSAQWQPGQSIVARPPMQELTLKVILQAVFGLREGARLSELQRLMSTMLDSFAYPISASFLFFSALQKDWGSWSPWGRFLRLREQVRQLLYAEIRDRRQYLEQPGVSPTEKTDILTLLLQARDENAEGMSDVELHDELVTLLLAGHETTASALVWMLYWIHYLPEVQQKLRAELADLDPQADPMVVAQVPYLTAVCQEALRIYPITPTTFVRVLRQPMTLAGYSFEAGTALMPATYIIHQRPDLYPEPKQFRPERFWEHQYAPHEYLPFGGGHRRCIGSALAMMELKLSIATLLQEFELTLSTPRPLLPARRGLTLAPPASMKLRVKSKRQN
ncbi:Cytochrome P450 [uncultured Synechococcales cyanobacterium]|uniref:Cytochrome P450 n=1 Tax=uncultured Synechococcales cyanobacterium TaxID=1936017 RepID=A0A6J4V638_9CYAN|nr:Cytochrome P450 [uncultured Synechococcales cyanobacterium]